MTSTSFNVGLTGNTRLSSRVLRPPGGGHTDIFGGEPEPPRGRRPAPSAVPLAPVEEPAKATNGTEEPAANGQVTEMQPEPQSTPMEKPVEIEIPQVETPTYEPSPIAENSPKPENSPKAEISKPEPIKAEPPKRVRVPPGGYSSGLW